MTLNTHIHELDTHIHDLNTHIHDLSHIYMISHTYT
jgi:hypothetical protein